MGDGDGEEQGLAMAHAPKTGDCFNLQAAVLRGMTRGFWGSEVPNSFLLRRLRRPWPVRRKRPVNISLSWASEGPWPMDKAPGGPRDRTSLEQKPQLP